MIQILNPSKIRIMMTHCWDITSSYPTKLDKITQFHTTEPIRDELMKIDVTIFVMSSSDDNSIFSKIFGHNVKQVMMNL